ncbi:hypothetical protein CCH79_00011255 [Gambusia affinis]|uniref:UAP56-interacting factor n=1 Tax=Gambusia affinis TaxID=33528 RepID=A0A315V2V2_GAMAF|nr:hypothetical protein CCH79_00011255 [Gambusia affinis]
MGPAETRSPVPLERFHSLSFPLCRPLPPVQQTQREARQATFLFRRGLKVRHGSSPGTEDTPSHSSSQNTALSCLPTRWRTSTAGSGILTVSIDNPTARTQPEPPTAWTLHPPPVSSAPVKVETEEKKVPKGVPLQFDINSVGKPVRRRSDFFLQVCYSGLARHGGRDDVPKTLRPALTPPQRRDMCRVAVMPLRGKPEWDK